MVKCYKKQETQKGFQPFRNGLLPSFLEQTQSRKHCHNSIIVTTLRNHTITQSRNHDIALSRHHSLRQINCSIKAEKTVNILLISLQLGDKTQVLSLCFKVKSRNTQYEFKVTPLKSAIERNIQLIITMQFERLPQFPSSLSFESLVSYLKHFFKFGKLFEALEKYRLLVNEIKLIS